MNKLIYLTTKTTPKHIKTEIHRIVQQLVKDNYAETKNKSAIRLFARRIPSFYRDNNTIRCFDGSIFVKSAYRIEETNNCAIRIRKNDKNTKS